MAPKAAGEPSSDSESVQIIDPNSSTSTSDTPSSDTSSSEDTSSERSRNANDNGAGPSTVARRAGVSGIQAGAVRRGRKRRRSGKPAAALNTNPLGVIEYNLLPTQPRIGDMAGTSSATPGAQAAGDAARVNAAGSQETAQTSHRLFSELISRVRRHRETDANNQQGEVRHNPPAIEQQPPVAVAAGEQQRPAAATQAVQPGRRGRTQPSNLVNAHRAEAARARPNSPPRLPQDGIAAGNRGGVHQPERHPPRGAMPQEPGREPPREVGLRVGRNLDYAERIQYLVRQGVRDVQRDEARGRDAHPLQVGPPAPPARNPFQGIHMLINERGRDRQQQLQGGVAGGPHVGVGVPVLADVQHMHAIPRQDGAVNVPNIGMHFDPRVNEINIDMFLDGWHGNMQRADEHAARVELLWPRGWNPREGPRRVGRNDNAAAALSPVCRVLNKFGIDYRVFQRASSESRLSDQDLLTLPDMPWDWALISKHKPSLQAETLLALQQKEWDYSALSRLAWSDEVILQLKDKNWDFKMLSIWPRSTELLFQTIDKAWDWHHLLTAMVFDPISKDALHSFIRKSLLLSDEVNWSWNEGFINKHLRDAMLRVALREITSKSKEPWDYERLSSAPWFPIDAIISVGMDKPWNMDALSARSDLTTDHLFDILPDAKWNTEVTNRNPHVVKATRRRRELLHAKAIIMKAACAPPRGRLYRRAIREFRKHQTNVTMATTE